MTYAWREIIPTQTGVFRAAWIIDAPWAHLVWSRYLLALYDLTTPAPRRDGGFLHARRQA
ncbi:hypothetical protein [Sinorhizobium medicae]|uniref:hypothetical protein n=1 Tax=Sinorhizobium medicae TaxID=110321 RepID=UPI00129711AD|nr:hypothetical protein [Sinorhizobium medicae]MQX77904.1 hypothetical protein [Sinorhizobium medicae]